MKKIFLFLILFFLLAANVKAYEFKKSDANPLRVTYINNYAYELQHHIFKEGNLYKGVFVINRPPETYYSLGYFESTDGFDWVMKKEILNIGSDLSNPSIIKTSIGYLLFVTKYENNTVYKIYSSNCDSDFNCSSSLVPVIVPNTNISSENKGVFAGHPFIHDSRTYLFFGAWGNDGFKIKLAYSDDLVNWQRCENDFLYGGDGPFPYQENNDLYLFFHRSDSSGIKLAKTSLPLTCESIFVDQGYLLMPDKSYDQKHLVFPSLVNDNSSLKLYYSGRDGNWNWSLNLALTAVATPTPLPTFTITPTPTLTSTPTLTPTPKALTPIIIIPGTFASWNKDAILHNIIKSQSDWKISPMVNEYKGIIGTLQNLGYEVDKNLFIFAYDWRKPVLEIVEDLKSYIEKLQTTTSFQIVGHSLGGLVGRIYSQKYNNQSIDKLVTVGSPHRGVSQYYSVVEAGEIERFNNYFWLTAKLISIINKNNFETDKVTLNRLFPMMKDLFPIYNFLKKDGVEINISDMKIKNELLLNNSYVTNGSNLTNLTSLVGEKGNTLKGFNIIEQTFIDKLLDNYVDGRPRSSYFDIGDYTVLSTSATVSNSKILNLDHGELIYKKEAIKKILDSLYVHYNDNQIVEGKNTTIDSSLIFLIKSPATMDVVINGVTYEEEDGIIFIENAESGNYSLKVKGITTGNYEVIIGQIGKSRDVWDKIYGETSILQVDNYDINYDRDTPVSYFKTVADTDSLFDDLINYLKFKENNWLFIKKVELGRNLIQKKNDFWNQGILISLKHEFIKNKDFIALEKLENIESKFDKKNGKKINKKNLEKIEERISKLKAPLDQVVLQEIVKRLDILKNQSITNANVLVESIEELLKVVKR